MDRMTMKIDGMSCGHCVSAVGKALAGLEGVQVEEVKVGTATIAFDPSATSESRITQAIEDEGYTVLSATR